MTEKKSYIDNLYYDRGKQSKDFRLFYQWIDKNGDVKCSKWKTYLEAQSDEKFIEKVNSRVYLNNEIILDYDGAKGEIKSFNDLLKKLEKDGLSFDAYETDEHRSQHVYLVFDKLTTLPRTEREEIREFIISKYSCDLAMKSDEHGIPLEGFPHWKTRQITKLVKKIEGINDISPIILELENKNKQILIKENLKLLEQEEQPSEYLDLGESPDSKFFYYGINLDGREAIITSDIRIFRNTEEHFKGKTIGENQIKDFFDYSGYIGDIAPRWEKKSIKEFITSVKKSNKRETYKQVRDKILYYMDFQGKDINNVKWENIVADVQICWVIATYCYTLFYWFPHLLFNAPSESGKSKNAFILVQLSFAGYDLGASAGATPAQIYRTLEGNRGTILIDEFERRENSETQQLVNQILNASATRDAYVIRTEQIDKKWRAWKFPIFCPKIVCNITGINSTSLSRFIVFHLLKTTTKKGKRKPYRKKDIEGFKAIRNDLHILILECWKEIKKIYDSLEIDLSNREEDSWLPICTVAKWLGEDVFKNVMAYISEYREIKIGNNDVVENLFQTIYENVSETEDLYSPKQIAEWMGDEISMYKSPAKWVGWKLKDYKFKKGGRRGSGVTWILSKSNVKNIIDRYFPETTTTNTLTTETTQNALTTQKDVDSVVNVVLPRVEEERVADPVTSEDIIKVLQANDNGNGKSSQSIAEVLNSAIDVVYPVIKELSKNGVIFEYKPDYWKVLE